MDSSPQFHVPPATNHHYGYTGRRRDCEFRVFLEKALKLDCQRAANQQLHPELVGESQDTDATLMDHEDQPRWPPATSAICCLHTLRRSAQSTTVRNESSSVHAFNAHHDLAAAADRPRWIGLVVGSSPTDWTPWRLHWPRTPRPGHPCLLTVPFNEQVAVVCIGTTINIGREPICLDCCAFEEVFCQR